MDRTLLKSLLRMLADLQVRVIYMCTCKLMVIEKDIFFTQSHRQLVRKKSERFQWELNFNYLLVTRPDALPLSYRRLMKAEATKKGS